MQPDFARRRIFDMILVMIISIAYFTKGWYGVLCNLASWRKRQTSFLTRTDLDRCFEIRTALAFGFASVPQIVTLLTPQMLANLEVGIGKQVAPTKAKGQGLVSRINKLWCTCGE